MVSILLSFLLLNNLNQFVSITATVFVQISQNLSGYNYSHQFTGTLPYCSPEVLQDQPYNHKTDIWALGCILYEMVTSNPAFNEFGEEALRQRILSYAIPQLPLTNFESIADLQEIYNLCMQRR